MTTLSGRIYKGKSLFDFPSDYTVIDIETTGLYTGESEIIEVSAIKCRGDEAVETFSTLIHPQFPISSFIANLTGITNELVKDAPCAKEALEEFYFFAGKDILVGHNVNFDVNFLYDGLMLHNNLVLDNSFVDVLRLARKALPFLPNHRQMTVAAYYGIETSGSHRALRDCEICNGNYLQLKRQLCGQ